MCRLQISRYVRLYAQDEAVFSQEDFQHLPRAFSSALVSARPIVAIRRTPCQGYASRLCGTLVTA
jgi:hypothetical protein